MKAIEEYINENKGLLSLLGIFAAISALFLTIPNPSESLQRVQFLFLLLFFFVLVFAAGRSLVWPDKNDTLINSLFSITFFLAAFEVGKMLYFDYGMQLRAYLLEPAILIVIFLGISQHVNAWYHKQSFPFFGGKTAEALFPVISLYGIYLLQRSYLLFAQGEEIGWSMLESVLKDTYLFLLITLSFSLLMLIANQRTKKFVVGMIILHILVFLWVAIDKFIL